MHDAIGGIDPAWIRRVLDAVGRCAGDGRAADVDGLRRTLAGAHRWKGCPVAAGVFAGEPPRYRRLSLRPPGEDAGNRAVLLIAWPGGHATSIHDHDGLWGVETVLEGSLHVESFRIAREPALQLLPQDSTTLEVGDGAAFIARDHAHRCVNPSARAAALTLHVYGGALGDYHAYRRDDGGRWDSVPQHAVSERVTA